MKALGSDKEIARVLAALIEGDYSAHRIKTRLEALLEFRGGSDPNGNCLSPVLTFADIPNKLTLAGELLST